MMLPSSPPEAFRIGVRPLGVDDWLVVDDALSAYLKEKARLKATRFGDVFMAEPGTEAAQGEVLAHVADYLVAHHPETYRKVPDGLAIAATGETVRLEAEPPLWTAARLCQEDLVLMRRSEAGWRIAAAALCFPSAWRLAEKFGRPMDEVHAHVPDFGAGTRNATIIARMFDNLRVETPMLRWNWGLYGDDTLFHPHGDPASETRFGAGGDRIFLRLERQTLSRLPLSGDIVFTIRIFLDPLPALAQAENGPELLGALRSQIAGFSAAQAGYKGLVADAGALMARLAELTGDTA